MVFAPLTLHEHSFRTEVTSGARVSAPSLSSDIFFHRWPGFSFCCWESIRTGQSGVKPPHSKRGGAATGLNPEPSLRSGP